jgi:hypothetical protein
MKKLNVIIAIFATTMVFFSSCKKENLNELQNDTAHLSKTQSQDSQAASSDLKKLYENISPEIISAAQLKTRALVEQYKDNRPVAAPKFTEDGANKNLTLQTRASNVPIFTINSIIAGHNIDVQNGNLTENNPIWQYIPNKTAAQFWTFYDAGNGYYYIRSKVSGKYLTVQDARTDAGAPIVQHSYSQSLAYAQQWYLVPTGVQGQYYYINRNSNLVMDVQWASNANGTILWQWPFNGSIAQKFNLYSATTESARYMPAYGGDGGGGSSVMPLGGLITNNKISRIFIRHGSLIDAVQVEWTLMDGSKEWSARLGGAGGTGTMISLDSDEYITTVAGRSGTLVDQLTFFTNKGRVYGPYGGSGGTPFSTTVSDGIKGFYGQSGSLVDKIGIIH